MGNAPSEDAAVGLAPGMEEIRPTDEPASAARPVQPHATEIVVTSSFRNAGEGEPAEGENAINGMTEIYATILIFSSPKHPKFVGGRGFAPDPTGGAHNAPPDP